MCSFRQLPVPNATVVVSFRSAAAKRWLRCDVLAHTVGAGAARERFAEQAQGQLPEEVVHRGHNKGRLSTRSNLPGYHWADLKRSNPNIIPKTIHTNAKLASGSNLQKQ